MSPRKDSCLIPAAASDQNSDGVTSFQRLSACQPSVMLARIPELASMTALSVAKSRQAKGPYDIGYRTAVGHPVPSPFGRNWQLFIVEKGVEIFLFDHVLRSDLACSKVTGSDPATDGLRVPPSTFRSLRHGNHCTILLQGSQSPDLGTKPIGIDRWKPVQLVGDVLKESR